MDAMTAGIVKSLAQLEEAIRESNAGHNVNVVTVMIALLEKGVVSADDLLVARIAATSLCDQEQSRMRDEQQREAIRDAVEKFSRGRK